MQPVAESFDEAKNNRQRYSKGATASETALCCSVEYDEKYLSVLPKSVLGSNYGSSDALKYLREGETVLILGSGTGKMCFIAAQIVGPSGHVIGVEDDDELLKVARKARTAVKKKLGYDNLTFFKGNVQDLRVDVDWLSKRLSRRPLTSIADLQEFKMEVEKKSLKDPLVADASVDVVISNLIMHRVGQEEKDTLFSEIFRVLKPGGKTIISDVVSDEEVPTHIQEDPKLWKGFIAGALQEKQFLEAFENACFYGITILDDIAEPWQVIEGIEFRITTVAAYKNAGLVGMEHFQAVVYKGPFASVEDDSGHVYPRGVRTAVGDATFNRLRQEPFSGMFDYIEPAVPVDPEDAEPFPCYSEHRVRDPHFTKWGSKSSSFSAAMGGKSAYKSLGAACCSAVVPAELVKMPKEEAVVFQKSV